MKPLPDDATIAAAIRQVPPHARAAWLFGRAARGRARRASDVDVALAQPASIVAGVTVTDPVAMAHYREWSRKAMVEHGAEILVRGGASEVLEGPWTPSRLVELRCTDRDAAKRIDHSETYPRARRLREGAGVMRMVVVDGVS